MTIGEKMKGALAGPVLALSPGVCRLAIQVTDPAGRPVEGASIEVGLAKHAFACRAFFGSYRVRVGFEGADFESVVEFPLLPDADGDGTATVVIPIGR